MAVSPLVSRQAPIQVRKPPQTPLVTTTAMANPGVENVAKDVSSPAAAKARTSMVNSSFVANIKTPVSLFQKTPQIPLQKAVLLSAGECMRERLRGRERVYMPCIILFSSCMSYPSV